MGRTRGKVRASRGVEALGGIEALLLPASDLFAKLWGLASLFYSPIELAGRLLQEFHQAQDLGAIIIEI